MPALGSVYGTSLRSVILVARLVWLMAAIAVLRLTTAKITAFCVDIFFIDLNKSD